MGQGSPTRPGGFLSPQAGSQLQPGWCKGLGGYRVNGAGAAHRPPSACSCARKQAGTIRILVSAHPRIEGACMPPRGQGVCVQGLALWRLSLTCNAVAVCIHSASRDTMLAEWTCSECKQRLVPAGVGYHRHVTAWGSCCSLPAKGEGLSPLAFALPLQRSQLRVYSPLPGGWHRPHRLGVWREGCQTDRWRR